MLNSTVVDVAVGLFLVYAMLSSLCSLLNEHIHRILDTRARELERMLSTLLDDRDGSLFAAVKNHALIRVIAHAPKKLPSYLSSATFSRALFEALVRVDGEHPLTFKRVRDAILQLPDGSDVKRALLALANSAENDIAVLRGHVEKWFDDAMDRLSGVYKRHVTLWIFALGFVVSAGVNADSLQLVQRLEHEDALRAVVTSRAERVETAAPAPSASPPAGQGGSEGSAAAIRVPPPDPSRVWSDVEQFQELDLLFWDTTRLTSAEEEARHPLAMRRPEWSVSWLHWLLLKLAGLAMTALAVSLGAPFWFDLLGRLVNLRATGAKPVRTTPSSAEPPRRTP